MSDHEVSGRLPLFLLRKKKRSKARNTIENALEAVQSDVLDRLCTIQPDISRTDWTTQFLGDVEACKKHAVVGGLLRRIDYVGGAWIFAITSFFFGAAFLSSQAGRGALPQLVVTVVIPVGIYVSSRLYRGFSQLRPSVLAAVVQTILALFLYATTYLPADLQADNTPTVVSEGRRAALLFFLFALILLFSAGFTLIFRRALGSSVLPAGSRFTRVELLLALAILSESRAEPFKRKRAAILALDAAASFTRDELLPAAAPRATVQRQQAKARIAATVELLNRLEYLVTFSSSTDYAEVREEIVGVYGAVAAGQLELLPHGSITVPATARLTFSRAFVSVLPFILLAALVLMGINAPPPLLVSLLVISLLWLLGGLYPLLDGNSVQTISGLRQIVSFPSGSSGDEKDSKS